MECQQGKANCSEQVYFAYHKLKVLNCSSNVECCCTDLSQPPVPLVERERSAQLHEVRRYEAQGGGAACNKVPGVLRGQCTKSYRLLCQVL